MQARYLLLVIGWLLAFTHAVAQSNAPTNLRTTTIAPNQVDLTWDDKSTNETKFEIERLGLTGSFIKIGEAFANTPSYQDKTVTSLNTYSYRVRAVFATNSSTYSNTLTVSTPQEAPGTPTGFSVTLQGSSIRISWSNGGGGSADNYRLERATSPGGPFQLYQTIPYSRTPSYIDNGVLPGQQYCYQVRAQGGGGNSAFTSALCATLPLAPTNVKNLKATAQSSTSVKVTWDRYGKESGITIQRSVGQNGSWTNLTNTLADGGEYIDNTAQPGTEYCYRIAEDGHEVSAKACDTTPAVAPVTPTGLTVLSIVTDQLQVFWTDINVVPVTFEISRSDKPGGTYSVIQPNYGAKIFDDKNLSASTQYCYRVRARNGSTYSGYSQEVCGTTKTPAPTAPDAPARLEAKALAYNQISLQWADLSNNEKKFQLDRSIDGGRTFTKLRDLDENTTTYVDQEVQGNQQYCYQIRAVNDVGTSAYTAPPACATTPAPPAGIPQNLVAKALSTTQINLTWQAVAGASGYQLERSPNGNDNWQKIADPAANATSYTDESRTPNTRYYYRIRALNAAGVPGDYSNVASDTTPDLPPTPPTGLTITAVAYNQISLKWDDKSTNETNFRIERSSDGTSWSKLTDVGENTTTYNDQTVAPQTRYYYRVLAFNAAGSSDYSNTADATTPAGPPAAAQNLTATATSTTQISLTWGAIANAETIVIERSPDGNSAWNSLTTVSGATTSYIDNGLTPNQTYFYRIRASNISGTGPNSNVVSATTPDVPPAPPTSLTASVISPTQINLAWADRSTNESAFEIEQGNSTTGTFTKIADLPANSSTYEVKGLTDNTAYCFRVRAKNAAGFSAYTEPACATTPLAPPATPTRLTAQLQDYDQIRLSWDPLSPKAVTVVIERSNDPNTGFTELVRLPASQTSYFDMGLQEFTTYYYRIYAINAAGNSGYSNVAMARVEEVIIGVEDELSTHTTLFVSQRNLHVVTDWYSSMRATIRLMSLSGQPLLTDTRKVNPADAWSYTVDRLPAGIYIIAIVADGRSLSKRIVVP
ncbi:fibronectin type III domain-containing protein [Spirosoma soli]|uniref:Fibronectin type III domain-containing protein n=1 Tax=Spirosoma soli TaxID=1770529 RepID=A0ABW5M6Q5_9BACT